MKDHVRYLGACAMSLLFISTASYAGKPQDTYLFENPPDKPFKDVMTEDKANKPKVMDKQKDLIDQRYDLGDKPSSVKMSGGRKAVQKGVRVKLPYGMSWEKLAKMSPDEIRDQGLFPAGFLPLPHVKHEVGGQVFPKNQIKEIRDLEHRSLERFDVEFDLPDQFTPEFPPPIFLSSRPDLGDVSQVKLLSIDNYIELMAGILTPLQMEGLRLLLTPFPQQQFNQTTDRKVERPSLGVACLDCHSNGHTNAAFHLTPDIRPQAARFRIDTVSLRGMFNQQIHGSKRSNRSVEDFSEFEQRTANFDGDQAAAQKKGGHLPERRDQTAMMAQMQNMFDFPPAPKLASTGKLIAAKASPQELKGQEKFFGKARCAECHPAPSYLDHQMHDLKLERFFKDQTINGHTTHADGPIKTFTLRGIKDSPPYLHDGRLLTLADTEEFFNLVLGLNLTADEKEQLVAVMLTL